MTTDAYVVAVEGLSALRDINAIPAEIKLAASQALNKTLSRTRTASGRAIREQVNLPASYVSDANGRLSITKNAAPDDLEGTITARGRATSLARFVTSGALGKKGGVRVEVAPGFAKFMKRAFLIRLKAGTADLDTQSNLGLAIRLKPGEVLANKHKMIRIKGNLYLLFGPSVSQIFATVATDQEPDALDFLESEFLRLMKLDS